MSNARYLYDGPVEEFDRVVTHRWKAETIAPSERKARSNLSYRFKQEFGKVANTRITLPGKITRVG